MLQHLKGTLDAANEQCYQIVMQAFLERGRTRWRDPKNGGQLMCSADQLELRLLDLEEQPDITITTPTYNLVLAAYAECATRCVRGDQQVEGVDFFDTYAPVVAWSTTRLLLILFVVLGLATKQVDYTNAFCQADLDEEVYVRMPKLFEKPGHVFRLKSVYGLRQSPKNFYETLKEALEDRGFIQSQHDPCLFISDTVICLFLCGRLLVLCQRWKGH
jgi:hypothetical protein